MILLLLLFPLVSTYIPTVSQDECIYCLKRENHLTYCQDSLKEGAGYCCGNSVLDYINPKCNTKT